jgi:hypothetical protein
MNKIFVSEKLDLIEHAIYKWTGEQHRLRWASSFYMSLKELTEFWLFPSFDIWVNGSLKINVNSLSSANR